VLAENRLPKTFPLLKPIKFSAERAFVSYGSGAWTQALYVDDNPDDRLMVPEAAHSANSHLRFLCVDGYPPAIAYLSGEGSFTDRQQYPLPVFVLLDYALNGHTGVDILRWIRAHRNLKNLPVVIYSSSESAERLAICYGEGANYYLHKASSFSRLTELMIAFDQCYASEPPCFRLLLTLSEYRPPP
jgi:CheY-like chemotaxis protein